MPPVRKQRQRDSGGSKLLGKPGARPKKEEPDIPIKMEFQDGQGLLDAQKSSLPALPASSSTSISQDTFRISSSKIQPKKEEDGGVEASLPPAPSPPSRTESQKIPKRKSPKKKERDPDSFPSSSPVVATPDPPDPSKNLATTSRIWAGTVPFFSTLFHRN
jgi:hypothetical protein